MTSTTESWLISKLTPLATTYLEEAYDEKEGIAFQEGTSSVTFLGIKAQVRHVTTSPGKLEVQDFRRPLAREWLYRYGLAGLQHEIEGGMC